MPAGASPVVHGAFRNGIQPLDLGFSCAELRQSRASMAKYFVMLRNAGLVASCCPAPHFVKPRRTAGKKGAHVSSDRMLNGRTRRHTRRRHVWGLFMN